MKFEKTRILYFLNIHNLSPLNVNKIVLMGK